MQSLTPSSSELVGSPEGLYLILAGLMYLLICTMVWSGVLHFRQDREKARHRRWWDRER